MPPEMPLPSRDTRDIHHARDLLHRVLLSHDNGWYSVGEPEGGDVQPYTSLFAELLPALRREGFSEDEIHQLVVTNPARAFATGVRKR